MPFNTRLLYVPYHTTTTPFQNCEIHKLFLKQLSRFFPRSEKTAVFEYLP